MPSIDLRDPWLAAFLAWLVPGLGHIYQRRWGKGSLFMVCILGTFFYGLWLGGGRVVYASFREPEFRDWRWAYVAQVANGLPALPAVVQSIRTGGPNPKEPLFGGFMAPPMRIGQAVPVRWVNAEFDRETKAGEKHPEFDPEFFDNSQVPVELRERFTVYRNFDEDRNGLPDTDQNGQWNAKYGAFFDLGTVFTVIAGLLNILAIWDAWGGPLIILPKPTPAKEKKGKDEAIGNAPGSEQESKAQ